MPTTKAIPFQFRNVTLEVSAGNTEADLSEALDNMWDLLVDATERTAWDIENSQGQKPSARSAWMANDVAVIGAAMHEALMQAAAGEAP